MLVGKSGIIVPCEDAFLALSGKPIMIDFGDEVFFFKLPLTFPSPRELKKESKVVNSGPMFPPWLP